jgi:hypothetical protein
MSPASLEKLYGALMLLRRSKTLERAEIPAPARFRILFSGIKPVLSRFQFANHLCSRSEV